MYTLRYSNRFKKDVKKLSHDLVSRKKLESVISTLASGGLLDKKHKDHALHGDFQGYRECHIEPDTLLIYQKKEQELVLILVRYGSHSKLFG